MTPLSLRSHLPILACVVVASAWPAAVAQTNWRQVTPAASPPAKVSPLLSYDSARSRVVLFDDTLAETWEWDGTRWSLRTPAHSPYQRTAKMAFDAARGVTVLVAGSNTVPYGHDTWTWDGTDWTNHGPMPGFVGYGVGSMGYDELREEVVLHGGVAVINQQLVFLRQTWTWDGSAWSRRTTANAPPGRYGGGLVFDPLRGMLLRFGGNDGGPGNVIPADLWGWDGQDWRIVEPESPVGPSRRTEARMAFDRGRGRLVVHGGDNGGSVAFTDTWEWDGGGWTRRVPPMSTNLIFGAMTYDVARGTVLHFGGATLPNLVATNATWVYGPVTPSAGSDLGTGCGGPGGIPALTAGGGRLAYAGQPMRLDVEVGSAMATAALVLSSTAAPPLALDFLGMPGCTSYVRPDIATTFVPAASGARWSFVVPAAAVGLSFDAQGWVLFRAPNGLAFAAVSNGMRFRIGSP